MSDRPRLPIPFGGGLDRLTGLMAVQPAAFSDLRNVYLRNGKMEMRGGLSPTATFAGETDILGAWPIRSMGVGAVITYKASTGDVSLWQVTAAGTDPSLIGVVWSLPINSTPPRIFAEDTYGKLIIAHDEPTMGGRKATMVYDALASTITALSLDLDRDATPGDVKFRGVRRYLAYIFGWGYGTESDADRPEAVRVSLPSDPTNFVPEHVFYAGQRSDPVVNCDKGGRVFLVRKASESYDIIGTDRATFGIVMGDPDYGQAGSRLGVTVSGWHYFWSLEGPRRSSGGLTEGLENPLALPDLPPDVLASSLDYDNGFATYLPHRKEILFVFGRWAFVLHIGDPSALRWSYRVYGPALFYGSRIFSAPNTNLPVPTATINAIGAPTASTIPVTINITGTQYGGEQAEVWAQPAGGAWARRGIGALSGSTPVVVTATALTAGTVYAIAVRVTRSGAAAAGYTSTDPSTWPVAARGTATTDMPAATIASTAWARTSAVAEQIECTLTAPITDPGTSYDGQAFIGGVWTNVTTTTDLANGKAILDATGHGETALAVRVRYRNAAATGAYGASTSRWVGPDAPTLIEILGWAGHLGWYQLTWVDGPQVTSTRGQSETDSGYGAEVDSGVGNTQPVNCQSGCPLTITQVHGRMRHRFNSFGVDDYSDYAMSGNWATVNC